MFAELAAPQHFCCAIFRGEERVHRFTQLVFSVPLLFLGVFCQEAWGLQSHGGPEGMVVHQFAHLQYLCALCYLLWDIRRSAFQGLAWIFLQRFCWLMIFWNILAFAGHYAQVILPEQDIVSEDGYLAAFLLLPLSFGRWIYYIAALDHLVCVPALFFLFLAMRTLYRQATLGAGERAGERP